MTVSLCEFDRHISSWYHQLVISTDTSACDHHLVISTDTSACYHHLVTRVISTETSACYRHPVSSTGTSWYHHLVSSTDTSWYHHLVSLCSPIWLPNEDFGSPNKPYGKALFNISYPKSSTHDPEKWFENTFRTVCSDFQNLRLGAKEFGMRWGSSCEFDRVGPTHHHDIIILWFRHSIIILIVRETHHFVISTDTSSWHHHLVS